MRTVELARNSKSLSSPRVFQYSETVRELTDSVQPSFASGSRKLCQPGSELFHYSSARRRPSGPALWPGHRPVTKSDLEILRRDWPNGSREMNSIDTRRGFRLLTPSPVASLPSPATTSFRRDGMSVSRQTC